MQTKHTAFKTYPHKINVHVRNVETGKMEYVWSTNAYPTCKAAIAAARALHPLRYFSANFAKE